MQQAAVRNFRVRMNSFAVKAREGGCGAHAVKAVAVIKDAKFHRVTEKLAILAVVSKVTQSPNSQVSSHSERLKVVQRFIAGKKCPDCLLSPQKRTTDRYRTASGSERDKDST